MSSSSFGFEWVMLLRQLLGIAFFGIIILCGVGAWNLQKAKARGGKMMFLGLLMQIAHVLPMMAFYATRFVPGSVLQRPLLSMQLYLSLITSVIGFVGLACFAIGYFLHSKHQRGLQARVDELERILEDAHQREAC